MRGVLRCRTGRWLQVIAVLARAPAKGVLAPSSPKDVTLVQLEKNPQAVNVNWQPPKSKNGVIIGTLASDRAHAHLLRRILGVLDGGPEST